jgi:Raf kinase inhibitor-like YbhB/YbcL family protein
MKARTSRLAALMLTVLIALVAVACDDTAVAPVGSGGSQVNMTVSSGAFANGAPIPTEYTCDGAGHQLPISWSGAPANTAEYALVMDDPDANGFVHWVVVGIPKDATALSDPLPDGAIAGQNGRGQAGYTGPCPPSGTHHYRIVVYALSAPLGLSSGATAAQVRSAAAGKTLATGELDGTYAHGSSPS